MSGGDSVLIAKQTHPTGSHSYPIVILPRKIGSGSFIFSKWDRAFARSGVAWGATTRPLPESSGATRQPTASTGMARRKTLQSGAALITRLWLPLIVAVLIGGGLPALTVGVHAVAAVAGCVLGCWAIATAMEELLRRTGGRRFKLPRQVVGMALAHMGIGVFVIGISLVSGYGGERDAQMAPGQTLSYAGHEFVFNGTRTQRGRNYSSQVGDFTIRRQGKDITHIQPAKRHYDESGALMTESGVNDGVFGDLYVSLGESLEDGAWSVRFYNRPFVRWIWGGGLLALSDALLASATS